MKYNENEPTVWAMNLEDWLVFLYLHDVLYDFLNIKTY